MSLFFKNKKEERSFEPPKDENGNPIAPPGGFRKGERPEPPKDENGNPIAPPEGFRKGERPEPPKDKDGNPIDFSKGKRPF